MPLYGGPDGDTDTSIASEKKGTSMNLGKAEKRLIVVDERAPAPAESRDQERDGHAAELAEQNADAPSATR